MIKTYKVGDRFVPCFCQAFYLKISSSDNLAFHLRFGSVNIAFFKTLLCQNVLRSFVFRILYFTNNVCAIDVTRYLRAYWNFTLQHQNST